MCVTSYLLSVLVCSQLIQESELVQADITSLVTVKAVKYFAENSVTDTARSTRMSKLVITNSAIMEPRKNSGC